MVDIVASLSIVFFRYHMKRCVDSGLWCPAKDDPATSTLDRFAKKDDEAAKEELPRSEVDHHE